MRVKAKSTARNGPYDATFGERELVRLIYEGEISIDELGRIWRIGTRYNNKLYSCTPKRAEVKTRDGYLAFRTMIKGKNYFIMAHRLVWQYFHGDIPEGMTINHINNVVDDNRPSNLELANMSDQNRQIFRSGNRTSTGEKNNNASLKQEQIEQIRILGRSGLTQARIAKMFGVSRPQISRILSGKSW